MPELEEIGQQLMTAVEEIGKDFEHADDDWLPVAHLYGPDGPMIMVIDPQWMQSEKTKNALLHEVLAPAIVRSGAKEAALVLAVWAIKLSKDNHNPEEFRKQVEEAQRVGISANKFRKEMVIVEVMNESDYRIWSADIVRHDDSPPTVGEWEEWEGTKVAGRFAEPLQAALKQSMGITEPGFYEEIKERYGDLMEELRDEE